MALYIDNSFSGSVSSSYGVEDMISDIEDSSILKMDDRERCFHVSEIFSRVTGEIDYISRSIRDKLASNDPNDIIDGYGDTSIVLGKTGNFSYRIVKWLPGNKVPAPDLERAGLAYELLHNHDFNLITKGVFGDGYETDIYRFDAAKIAGAIGEKVDLQYQGRFKLRTGSVLWYEKCYDVHTQVPPESFSMSFNIIPRSRDTGFGQFIFDRYNGVISQFARNGAMRTLSALTLLCDVKPDDESRALVAEAAASTDSEWLKLALCAMVSERWGISKAELFPEFGVRQDFFYASALRNSDFSSSHVR